jgi:hypothetical protein
MVNIAQELSLTHPEEIRGDFDLRIGRNIDLQVHG